MIHLVQCLCPRRHCILAVCSDDEPSIAEGELRRTVQEALLSGAINPWCALCGAPARAWRYETAPTVYQSMDEALPSLERLAAENQRTRDALIASGRAFDSKQRGDN